MFNIIASVSGVRGIMGKNLTPDNINVFTSAFAEYCRETSKSKKIVVGRDGRIFGSVIANMVISNLILAGYKVIYIGIAPTPTIQIATEELKAAGGVAITASHNPQEWNGLKFLNSDGTFLDLQQNKRMLEIASKGKFKFEKVQNLKNPEFDDTWLDKHINKVLKLKSVNIAAIKKRKFKVVVDAVNSAASVIAPALLRKLGCRVTELFCDESGVFPHTPEPLPHNLVLLSRAVKKQKADLGIAIDPDSDRLVLITEKGEPYSEENTVTTAIKRILRYSNAKRKAVTVNLSTTRAVDDIANQYGAKTFRSPVGEINVVKEMKRNKSIAGGEGSGGVIIPEIHYGRDALAALGVILSEFAETGLKVSEYKNKLPQYFITKAKIEVKGNPNKVLKKVISNHRKQKCIINTDDGVKLDFDNYWIHLRKSNTEPIIRIITEAKSSEEAERIQKGFISGLNIKNL